MSLLRIEPVRAGRDDAPYECIAENGVGDAVSAEATLTVYEGSKIRSFKDNQVISILNILLADKTPAGFPSLEVLRFFSFTKQSLVVY